MRCKRCAPISPEPCQSDSFNAYSSRLPPSHGSFQIAKYEYTVHYLANSSDNTRHWQPLLTRSVLRRIPHTDLFAEGQSFFMCSLQQQLDELELFAPDVARVTFILSFQASHTFRNFEQVLKIRGVSNQG